MVIDVLVWSALAAGVALVGLVVWIGRAVAWFDPDDPRW
jgi:hypothetical protein